MGILASTYAPALTEDVILESERPIAFILPMAPSSAGPLFMVPVQRGRVVFGVQLQLGRSHKVQVEEACEYISIGIESHYMHGIRNARNDIVVAVPWDRCPEAHVDSQALAQAAKGTGIPAIWCSLNALADTPVYEPALHAAQRCAAMQGAVMHDDVNVGMWTSARPTVLRRRARAFSEADDSPDAEMMFQAFLAAERGRKAIMQADLLKEDAGSGLVADICRDVRTAADFEAEIPIPPMGMPSYDDGMLLFVVAPERPTPLIKEWLHRLPPQALPPGFRRLKYTEVLRQWTRRMAADKYNRNMRFDAHCLDHGEAPEHGSRAKSFTIGKGGAHSIPHADGIGSYNPLDLLLETIQDGTGDLDAVDFTIPENRKWVFEAIAKHIGDTGNQEILSFLFHGVRWKVDAPRQIRFSKNLQRYDTRAAKFQKALEKLHDAQYVTVTYITPVDKPLTAEDNPFIHLPQYECSAGVIDKADGTGRIVGDMSDPHDKHLERNSPDGEPDGPVVLSFNELSGPKGKPKPDYDGDPSQDP